MKTQPGTLALSDMLKSGSCVLVFVTIIFVGFANFATAEYTVYNNGWIPVSPDTVYNQVRREFDQTISYHSSEHKDDTEQYNDKFSSLKRGSEIGDKEDAVYEEHLNERNEKLGPMIFQQKTRKNNQDVIYNNRETLRKAKKIAEYVVNKGVNDNIVKAEKEPAKEETINEITQRIESGYDDMTPGNVMNLHPNIITKDSTNIYEVTEDPKIEYTRDQSNLKNSFEYYYKPPVIENLTSKFSEILSKYNIKADDKLQNYELSRLGRGDISMKQNYRVPLLIPNRHNSPNHVPIDPLFAVFLSNYGIYLPGMYGINSNYNNLYGYLASNNIHNNKPFGMYKVYSDTDSSN